MNSLSVGVRSVFSPVNCLSKLLTSLRCFCTHANAHAHARNEHTKHYILARSLCDILSLCNILSMSETYDFRFERRLHFAVFDSRPVDTPEKHVAPDVFFASGTFAQSLHRVFRQKLIFFFFLNKKQIVTNDVCSRPAYISTVRSRPQFAIAYIYHSTLLTPLHISLASLDIPFG